MVKILTVYTLSIIQEWSSFVQLLQTELSDNKQKNDQLEDELTKTQANVFKLQEEIERKEVLTNFRVSIFAFTDLLL